MAYGDLVSRVDFDMKRDSPFSYACHACNRCCRNKAIRVGSYEILRLARYLGISTTQFIENHTEAGGTVLRSKENGDCAFLGERGCSVHPDRPLACRIYPLARWVSPDGEESFGHLTPHPKTEGVYGISRTVQDYLDHQQLAPFFEMSERYGSCIKKWSTCWKSSIPKNSTDGRTGVRQSTSCRRGRWRRCGWISTRQMARASLTVTAPVAVSMKPWLGISVPLMPGLILWMLRRETKRLLRSAEGNSFLNDRSWRQGGRSYANSIL
jgi:Fe-S-cluster containining protein